MAQDLPKSICAGCGAENDCGTSLGAEWIKPGDISVCLYCGHLAAMGWDQRLRPLTDDEMHKVAGDKRLLVVQKARFETMKAKRQ